jgi:hypothetical protein
MSTEFVGFGLRLGAFVFSSQKNEGKRLGSESRFHKAALIVVKLRTLGDLMFFGEDIWGASNSRDCGLAGLRLNINTDGPTELTSITVAEAVEHYKLHELADRGQEGKAYSTRDRKTHVLNRWVLPQWGKFQLRAIKTVAVEQWLRTLVTSKFGKPKLLAGGTREKMRDTMSCLFNHAIRWEFTDRNPITGPVKGSGVRVSAKRERTPDILEVQEMHRLPTNLL